MKKTIVLGASPNPNRYAYHAVQRLKDAKYEVIPVGIKKGEIEGIPIQNGKPNISDVDTITLYINPTIQKSYYDYIFKINPKRIIFNPGTENIALINLAKAKGIETEVACTLVMLSVGTY